MPSVQLDGSKIADWNDFHTLCAEAFGFPDFYGRTIDAWIDCLSYLRDDENMTKFRLQENDVLQIVITHADDLRKQAPDLLEEVAFCVEGINDRYTDYGEKPALFLKLA
ncbi:barstar family protein [Oxalicibacterium solurbis]|uniref:Barnase inhibitor n=1 Tax=Oxalicibacterium solurbis TaxID=69280 RepID=A0A8J3F427_9BURK|nr:barstar family protein [Oxalicibacterium solurbis]GGI54107.1 barnase inhibitor [Oxalicibacterium solurbis]